MVQTMITALLWFSCIGCGMMAGLYFAFSAFIMTAFARIDEAHGIAAMNAINSTIVKSVFMPLFWGTTLAAAALAGLAPLRWSAAGSAAMLAGGLVYLLGMFFVTVMFNVPLNNQLARAATEGAESNAVWTHYLGVWTAWNHIRTVASTVAAGLFIAALVLRSGNIN